MKNLEILYKTLAQRKRPEDVAELISSLLVGQLSYSERKTLERASSGSLRHKFLNYTSMAEEFAHVIGAEKQVTKAVELFKLEKDEISNYASHEEIYAFINNVSQLIHKSVGKNNFRNDRLPKLQRKEMGLDISKRQYNKRWRLLKRLENKLRTTQRETRKLEFQKISKHGIAHHLDFKNFSSDINTACFIAYFNSRSNLRSVFTNQKQARAYDEISNMLFKRCLGNKGKGSKTNWLAISYIYTSQEVLSQLTDHQKGQLLGKWTNILKDIANLMDEVWSGSQINRASMVVKKGNDSTTWNNTAGAWNKARDNWINLIYALGMDYLLEQFCPGKAMRLMAADVVFWHYASGSKLDPNTEVWNKVPLPWQVFKGEVHCDKELIVKYCKKAGIDAEKSGWITPRQHGVVEFKPTPELVHGVEVSNPFIATYLKKRKVFSGK